MKDAEIVYYRKIGAKMFIVIHPMLFGKELLIYDTVKLTGKSVSLEDFQSTVGQLGVETFVNVISISGIYQVIL